MPNEIKNADMPAFPLNIEQTNPNNGVKTQVHFLGLTKREEIASRIAAGFSGNSRMWSEYDEWSDYVNEITTAALDITDSLLEKLQK